MDQKEIRLVDLWSERKEAFLDEIFSEFREVFKNSQYVMGAPVKAFEEAYARLTDCQYAVAVNSGTDGLYLALRALGVGPGDEVITVSNSFIASVGAIVVIGAKPVLVDIDYDYNIDVELIERAITPRTKAILPVHLTGYPCKMDRIQDIAGRHRLFVVEDAAQAIGSKFQGKAVGSFGNAASFSLHPLKNLHVWGDGGMITTNDEALAENLRLQRNHGLRNRDEVDFFSFNSRLDTLQAIVGLKSVSLLDETTRLRRRNAAIYDQRLKNLEEFLKRPVVDTQNAEHTYHLYVVAAENRDALMNHLLKDGIETKIHYPIPAHLQKAGRDLGYQKGDLPVTETLAGKILSLPIRENLSESQIHRVCDSIEAFYKK